MVPEGAVPFIAPPICPAGGVPDGAVPFISPAGGVPGGEVPFICSAGVPEGAALLSAGCWTSVTACEDEVTALLADEDVELVELVHPAIIMPAMRIADAINITIMLFFMDYSPDRLDPVPLQEGSIFRYCLT